MYQPKPDICSPLDVNSPLLAPVALPHRPLCYLHSTLSRPEVDSQTTLYRPHRFSRLHCITYIFVQSVRHPFPYRVMWMATHSRPSGDPYSLFLDRDATAYRSPFLYDRPSLALNFRSVDKHKLRLRPSLDLFSTLLK